MILAWSIVKIMVTVIVQACTICRARGWAVVARGLLEPAVPAHHHPGSGGTARLSPR